MSPDADEEPAADAANQSALQRFRNGMLWKDTVASARRFFWGLALLFPAVLLGLHMGVFPYFGVFFLRFILFFDKIIALSVLPILFIAFGIDELSKVMLIVIGVTPTIILDTFNLTKSVPPEQLVKGFTLGASDFDVAYRVVLKQIWPRVLNSIRLNLKPLMLFLVRRRNDRLDRRPGVSHRSAAPPHGNEHHHSLRSLGCVAAVPGGSDDATPQQETTSMVPGSLTNGAQALLEVEPATAPLIRLENIHVSYALKDGARKKVLDGIDLAIRPGEFISVVGQTGCGKSTLLRLILGAELPTSGRVLVDGREITRPDRDRGYVPQKYSLFPDKTVIENITFGPEVEQFNLLTRLAPRFYRRRKEFRAEARAPAPQNGACTNPTPASTRTSSPAACSSAWRLRRRWSCGPRSC